MPALPIAVRRIVPAAVVLAGAILRALGPSREAAATIVAAGLSIWLLNELYRLWVRGDEERDAKDAARGFFDRYGRWREARARARRWTRLLGTIGRSTASATAHARSSAPAVLDAECVVLSLFVRCDSPVAVDRDARLPAE